MEEVENQNMKRLQLQDSGAQWWHGLSGAFVSGKGKMLLYLTDFKDPNLQLLTSLSRPDTNHGQFPEGTQKQVSILDKVSQPSLRIMALKTT
ncbi:hypothetical protein LINPERPRIM_LOCUS40956 [Linum perenne]